MAYEPGGESPAPLPVAGLAEVLLDASPDAVIVVDMDGIIQSCTRAAQALFGYRPEELVGQRIEVLVPERLRGVHVSHRTKYASAVLSRPMGLGLSLYGQRRDGSTFPVDIGLAPVHFASTECVAAFVRDGSERHRSEALLRNVNEISQELLAGKPIPAILALTARRARYLAGGAVAWAVVPAGPGRLAVAAADGRGSADLIGATMDASTSLSGRAMIRAEPITIENLTADADVLAEARCLGLGPGLFLPLSDEQGGVGVLVVARDQGAEGFTSLDQVTAQLFASAAGVVLALGQTRAELEELQLVAEHERIARDLHDTVIQRLFAIGMGLQSIQSRSSPPVTERIDASVQALDTVIRDIRETIFDLNRGPSSSLDLRQRIGTVLSEAALQLGFEPTVVYRGPFETTVDDDMAGHLLAVLREALSNAARHARAGTLEVVVSADAAFVVLTVTDDGVGISGTGGTGDGLRNMAQRARQLGGRLEIGTANPRGTALEWRVPVGGQP
ncbi:MAG: PAS domain S-box protein [Acidimicrobiales bacterium]